MYIFLSFAKEYAFVYLLDENQHIKRLKIINIPNNWFPASLNKQKLWRTASGMKHHGRVVSTPALYSEGPVIKSRLGIRLSRGFL
jgi:hypothetical protein